MAKQWKGWAEWLPSSGLRNTMLDSGIILCVLFHTCVHKEMEHFPRQNTNFCISLVLLSFAVSPVLFLPSLRVNFQHFSPPQSSYQKSKCITVFLLKLGHRREGGDGGAAGLQQTPPPQHPAQGRGSAFPGAGAAQWWTVLPVLRVCGCHVRLHKQFLRVLCGAGSQQWRGGMSEAAQWDHSWFWWSKSEKIWVNKVNWIHEFYWALLSSWRRVVCWIHGSFLLTLGVFRFFFFSHWNPFYSLITPLNI